MKIDFSYPIRQIIPASCLVARAVYPYAKSSLMTLGGVGVTVGKKAGGSLWAFLKERAVMTFTDYTSPENFAENFENHPARVIYGFLRLLKKNPKQAEERLRAIIHDYKTSPESYRFTVDAVIEDLLLTPEVLAAKQRLLDFDYPEGKTTVAKGPHTFFNFEERPQSKIDADLYDGAKPQIHYFVNFFVNTCILANKEVSARLFLSDMKPEKNLHEKPGLSPNELFSRIATKERIEGLKGKRGFKKARILLQETVRDLRKAKIGWFWRVVDYYPRLKGLLSPLDALLEDADALQPMIARLISVAYPETRKRRIV